eukprot:3480395-Amphidinium_carterae.1
MKALRSQFKTPQTKVKARPTKVQSGTIDSQLVPRSSSLGMAKATRFLLESRIVSEVYIMRCGQRTPFASG